MGDIIFERVHRGPEIPGAHIMRALWDFVSVGVVGLVTYPLWRLATTGEVMYAIMLGGVVLADYATKLVKDLTRDSEWDVLKRPRGATDCDIFCRAGEAEGDPGMPSGHMTMTVFILTFIYLIEDIRHRGAYLAVAALVVVLMALARHQKRCHNLAQILAGSAWGLLSAWAIYALTQRWMKLRST